MAEKRFPLALPPGVKIMGTDYQAKGRWSDSHLIRFFQGTIRPWGSWSRLVLDGDDATAGGTPEAEFPYGEPRAMIEWAPDIIGAAQPPVIAVGTTTGLYVIVNGDVFDITPTEIISAGERDSRVWTLDVFGSYLVAAATDVEDFLERPRIFVWTGDTATVASAIAEAPAAPTSLVVTEERFLFQLAGADPLGPNYTNFPDTPSVRTVFWASRERLTDWTPTNTNTAGSFPLATNGALLAGRRLRGQTLLWTTTDLHAAIFIGGEFVYRFQQVGDNCGAISTHAPVVVDNAAFWMGPNGFFAFDGAVRPIPCEVHDRVFEEIDRTRQHLTWGLALPQFGEVIWWYPTGAQNWHYVVFNYREGHWAVGTLSRSCGLSRGAGQEFPILATETFEFFRHEDPAAFGRPGPGPVPPGNEVPYLQSGPIEIEEGDRLFDLQAYIPDEGTVGDVALTVITNVERAGPEPRFIGPFPMAARTDIRASGRQISLYFEEVDPIGGTYAWQIGAPSLVITPAGRR